jgi:CheY-like chemotaxis protein/anti-sigma regulatory factor (Ser/Thr protein kinase)
MGPLREVLVNLVLNAIDALPEGGQIKIRTWADTGWVHCSVTDTGVGMSAEVRRRALEPFYTTKGVKSTGLGLSVNYGILQRLGGDMVVESEEGRGTTILIKLPVADARAAEPEPPLERPLRALCILVIDDEPEVRMMLADLLTDDGHHVIEAASGAEGLQHLENQRPVDVVLSDLGMPGMTGWEVARAVKARRADLPVVLITGWGETPEQRPDDRGSADLVLAKPVTSLSLRSALARVVAAS